MECIEKTHSIIITKEDIKTIDFLFNLLECGSDIDDLMNLFNAIDDKKEKWNVYNIKYLD